MPKRKAYLSERDLSSEIMLNLNSELVTACWEVPMLGRSIDLVLLKNQKIISIEFKLNNWRGAIRQATDYLLASDLVYICMPKRKISEDFLNQLTSTGIGLYFPSPANEWPFEEIVKARPSKRKWAVARKNLKSYLIKSTAE